MKRRLTRAQMLAQATKKARAERRWRIIRDASGEGLSKAEAALRAGLTDNGLNSLLYRNVGSRAWPISASPALSQQGEER